MERRRVKRITFGVRAESIIHGRHVPSVIEDLSETGACILTGPVDDTSGLVEGANVELKFRPVDLEVMVLNCMIQWIRKAYPNRNLYKLGMVVIDPPWDESRCFL